MRKQLCSSISKQIQFGHLYYLRSVLCLYITVQKFSLKIDTFFSLLNKNVQILIVSGVTSKCNLILLCLIIMIQNFKTKNICFSFKTDV